MERIKIFEPCEMEYPKANYGKPVKYTDDFLKEIAANTISVPLVDEVHGGKKIGTVKNFTFTDGGLYADIDSEKPLDDLKYSPSYNSWLVDESEYKLATKGEMLEVALTRNPRKAVLNNTADDDNGGSKMGKEGTDGTLEFFQNEVKRLQQENNKLEFKLNQANDKIKSFDEKETELEELREWKETNEKIIAEQKPIIEKYKEHQQKTHEELLEKVSNGDDTVKERYKDFSTDQLETILETYTQEQPAHGVGAQNAPGLNEGSGETKEETERAERNAAVESMFGDLFAKEE